MRSHSGATRGSEDVLTSRDQGMFDPFLCDTLQLQVPSHIDACWRPSPCELRACAPKSDLRADFLRLPVGSGICGGGLKGSHLVELAAGAPVVSRFSSSSRVLAAVKA